MKFYHELFAHPFSLASPLPASGTTVLFFINLVSLNFFAANHSGTFYCTSMKYVTLTETVGRVEDNVSIVFFFMVTIGKGEFRKE